jgi:hypothetical protein
MNLDEIQPFVAARIAEHPALAALRVFDPENPVAGSGIVVYRGTFPKTAGREESLATHGACFIVDVFTSDSLEDAAKASALVGLNVSVLVEENPKRNTALPSCERLAQYAAEAVIGKGTGRGFRLASNPFEHLGQSNGLTQVLVNFTIRQTIASTAQ